MFGCRERRERAKWKAAFYVVRIMRRYDYVTDIVALLQADGVPEETLNDLVSGICRDLIAMRLTHGWTQEQLLKLINRFIKRTEEKGDA